MNLSELTVGKSAFITSVGGEGSLRQHFLDMGLIPGVEITLVKLAPMGDPMEFRVRGYELTLRVADAANITIDNLHEKSFERVCDIELNDTHRDPGKHPGYGEGGVFHIKSEAHPLPEGTLLSFALAGNQNCGKTTLFNQLTGSNQHVGNFPGVTVDKKDGEIKKHPGTIVTDLPGIYSLSPYTNEELVTRHFILGNRPKGIINIVDATNIERNLYLTMQLIELNIPMVLALNMMDEVRSNGGTILVNKMEQKLGIPVIPISAAKNEGIDELIEHALHVAQNQEAPSRTDFCPSDGPAGAVHRCIHAIMHLIDDHARNVGIPLRFAASKLAEGDKDILERLKLDQNEKEMLQHLLLQMEEERGLDCSAAIADMRFNFIEEVCRETVIKPRESKEYRRSKALDKILTGKLSAIPSFIAIMGLLFWMTFGVVGDLLSGWLENGIEWATHWTDIGLTNYGINPVVHSLVIDGIFAGVGTVLSFLPYIVVLFFFLSMLEDSGYMARVAFVMDKLLRKIGLSGRSIVPMLIGFGCSVPGIMASRTLPSNRDRKMTVLLTPFMSCSAKLPIYALFSELFFPKYAALVMIALYFTGIIVGVMIALVMKKSLFRGSPVPFVMELPNYRMPSMKNVGRLLWDKSKDFVEKAFTIIFVAAIVIWFLQSFDLKLNVAASSQDSILALLAGFITPLFEPLGFSDWRISTALITGLMAKESVVSSLTVLYGGTSAISAVFSNLGAIVFLVFVLLYTPCVAAISAVKRELGGKWALAVVVGQCLLAWFAAYLVKVTGLLLGVM